MVDSANDPSVSAQPVGVDVDDEIQAAATGAPAERAMKPENHPPVVVLATSRRPDVISRLLLWLVFGVLFGMMPLWAVAIKGGMSAGGISLAGVLGNGELFIVSAVIAAGAIGEMFVADLPSSERNYRIIGGGCCLLACSTNAIAYTLVSDATPKSAIVDLSLIMFGFTALTSGFCIGLAAGR